MIKKKPGRPVGTTGTGKYGEPTKPIRVPVSLVERCLAWIKQEKGVR